MSSKLSRFSRGSRDREGSERMANINLPVDSEVHRRLKIQAIRNQTTLKAYIISCLEEIVTGDALLKKTETGQSAVQRTVQRTPQKTEQRTAHGTAQKGGRLH